MHEGEAVFWERDSGFLFRITGVDARGADQPAALAPFAIDALLRREKYRSIQKHGALSTPADVPWGGRCAKKRHYRDDQDVSSADLT